MSSFTSRTVFLALPEHGPCDWSRVLRILSWHAYPACLPHTVLPVRRPGLTRRLARTEQDLLEPVRHPDGITRCAGGPVGQLDLHALATQARTSAEARWWTWQHLVAATTPAARSWDHFLGQHLAEPDKVTRAEARKRFEAQPRVLAMLAHNTYPGATHQLLVEELDDYQAGQAVYVALHWQQSLTGEVLIDSLGRLLKPASASLADRLRYLAEASRVVHSLSVRDRLAAVRGVQAP